MSRLFLAIEIPAELRKKIYKDLVKPLAKLKAVKEDNLHITLCFIGEADEKQVIEKLGGLSFEPFRARLHEVGDFGGRVAWLGVQADEAEKLAEDISAKLGIRNDQGYKSHLTLARGKEGVDFYKEFAKIKKSIFDERFIVGRIILFRSELAKEGPTYSKAREFTAK